MPDGTSVGLVTFASQNPRHIIWLAAMNTIALVYHSKTLTVQSRDWSKVVEALGNFMVRDHILKSRLEVERPLGIDQTSQSPSEAPKFPAAGSDRSGLP